MNTQKPLPGMTSEESKEYFHCEADEESFDFSSALLIAIFIYSLYKSIQGRCARL